MRIVNNNLEIERLRNNPIFRLTGCMETTQFFSNLASACVKFGTFLERVIGAEIQRVTDFPFLTEIGQSTLYGQPDKYMLVKPKFGKTKPDLVFVDGDMIRLFEIKVNLRSSDSKKAHGETDKYKKARKYLKKNYPDYTVQTYAVDFFGGGGGSTALYERANVFTVINGKTFCEMMGINYDIVCINLEVDQDENRKFIRDYIEAVNRKTL